MAKYLFVYHGGTQPSSKDELATTMDKWGAWFGSMGTALIDGGNPVTGHHTVDSGDRVTKDGGANPAGGYSLVEAASIEEATAIAKRLPHVEYGGSVEIGEAQDM